MEFNDCNQWHRVTDRAAYEHAGLPMIEIRACSASSGTMVHDTEFEAHRRRFDGFPSLFYQFPFGTWSPEAQADYFADQLGALGPLEMGMLDLEAGSHIGDPAGFTQRWLARFEGRFPGNRAWVYVPRSVASPALYGVIEDRVVKAPRYSGGPQRGTAPDWGRWDVHQFSDRAPMPGSPDGPGDRNWTALSVGDLLARSRSGADVHAPARRRRVQLLL